MLSCGWAALDVAAMPLEEEAGLPAQPQLGREFQELVGRVSEEDHSEEGHEDAAGDQPNPPQDDVLLCTEYLEQLEEHDPIVGEACEEEDTPEDQGREHHPADA